MDACALIQPVDVASLVGGAAAQAGKPTPMAKALHGKCTWTDKIVTLDVMVQTIPNDYSTFLNGMRTTAGFSKGNIVVTDESGIGEAALSELMIRKNWFPPEGVTFIICKHHRILQIAYSGAGKGVEATRDLVRPIARRAADRF